jgi:predicted metalloprotease with PDZ domain
VHYEVYANDPSVRTAWLDATRGFFNGTSLCLQVVGQQDQAHALELLASDPIAHWSVATGLEPVKVNKQGFGTYRADHYDTLVDCPFELGPFWSGSFTACGIARQTAGGHPGHLRGGDPLLAWQQHQKP